MHDGHAPFTLCSGVLANAENTISGGGYTVLLALRSEVQQWIGICRCMWFGAQRQGELKQVSASSTYLSFSTNLAKLANCLLSKVFLSAALHEIDSAEEGKCVSRFCTELLDDEEDKEEADADTTEAAAAAGRLLLLGSSSGRGRFFLGAKNEVIIMAKEEV